MNLFTFKYNFKKGPVDNKKELEDFSEGNCRLAIQYYFYQVHDKFLKPEQILCPQAYHKTGEFVFRDREEIDFGELKDGDIIYAEKIKDKDGETADKGLARFSGKDKWITALHSAIFTDQKIWHATAIEGKSCFWTVKKFLEYYRPVSVKRIIDL